MQAHLLTRHEIDTEKWDAFVQGSPQYSIYALSVYLDEISPGWQAVIAIENGQWYGVLPLNIKKKYGISYTLQPILAQYTGILLRAFEGKMYHVIHLKKTVVESILQAIPQSVRLFNHNFSPDFEYFVACYWHGYQVRPQHSYWLDLSADLPDIYANFSGSVKTRINQGTRLGLQVITSKDPVPLLNMMLKRNIISQVSAQRFSALWQRLAADNKAFMLYITDPQGSQVYCGGAFIIDRSKLLFKASALDYGYKNTGANDLLIWNGIQKAKEMEGITIFDFTGSMIKNIENYLRTFGARPIVYYNVSKDRLPLIYRKGYAWKEKFVSKSHVKLIEPVMLIN